MPQRRFAGSPARHGRTVHVAKPFFLVSYHAFVFEHAKLSADGRVVRLPGEVAHHFRGRRAAAAIEDVHDLAFTAGQGVVSLGRHRCYDHNICAIKITQSMLAHLKAAVVATLTATTIALTSGQTSPASSARQPRAGEFLERLKLAVDSADRRAVSAMIAYPLTVLASGFNIPVKDAPTFVRMYDSVLTPELRCAVAASQLPTGNMPAPRHPAVITPDGLSMVEGAIWAPLKDGRYLIARVRVL